jgi:hypothetical protein
VRRKLAHFLRVAAGDEQTAFGEQPDQLLVGLPERLGRWVEVRMVVLGAGQQERLGLVVEELGAAVEVRRVVLVPFDDEAVSFAILEARGEVLGRAADQVSGILSAEGVDPGRHRGRGRLAVRPRHHQGAVPGEEEAGEGLGHREHREPQPLGLHSLRVTAVHGVAHHHQIGRGGKVPHVEPHGGFDAGALQESAHRRIERAVGPADAVALLLQQTGERSHPCTPDRHAVDVEF